MKLICATKADFSTILKLIEEAKYNMKQMGVTQWTKDYPNEEVIRADIERQEMLKGVNSLGEIVCVGTLSKLPFNQKENLIFRHDDYFIKRLVSIPGSKGYAQRWVTQCLVNHPAGALQDSGKLYTMTNHSNLRMQALLEKIGFYKVAQQIVEDREDFGPFYIYTQSIRHMKRMTKDGNK